MHNVHRGIQKEYDMGMLSASIKPGSWSISSSSDRRWNAHGRTAGWSVMGGMPPEARKKVEELKKLLGDPPRDLQCGFMKD